ncbi:MAG TPA: UDP-glucose--hexose-1-phosphate uridylyltransferase [Candidatus Acidoferrum sp.]|nr:UDP-glucose--hexose-1-phosphate uridylyltransferase [Candidatus Acidoferrum sp.]
MSRFDLKSHPHRRFNPLSQQWVLVSPHRAERPWQGQVEGAPLDRLKPYDADCYLCPGNARAGGVRNPNYKGTFAFENDFAALKSDTPEGEFHEKELIVAVSERGYARVVCFSPRHDLTLARMEIADIERVVDTWTGEFHSHSSQPSIQSVQIFENRGAIMGCSNPHPHGQIWANETIPDELARESASFAEYSQKHKSGLLEDYLQLELEKQERVVAANSHFVALVPFWAIWPFEILVVSRRRISCLTEFEAAERRGLADILSQVTIRYDNLFKTPFPYTMGFHQVALAHADAAAFHFHSHFYPPLLRSATVKKFMVGYEMLAMPQRDIAPEATANRLKQLPAVHYLSAK